MIRGDKNQGKEVAVNDGTAAYRLREQLKRFVGIVLPHVPKTQKEFPGQMSSGIQAGQTTAPGRIARAPEEDILLKRTEERLSRHLLAEGLDATVQDAVPAQGAACMHDDTIVSIDPSDIQKPYTRDGGMPLLAKAWDGGRGRVGDNLGYNLYFARTWPGLGDRLAVLAYHARRVSKRMFDVPDFFFYAIADGLRTLFSRHGRWNGLDGPDMEPEEPCQMILAL